MIFVVNKIFDGNISARCYFVFYTPGLLLGDSGTLI